MLSSFFLQFFKNIFQFLEAAMANDTLYTIPALKEVHHFCVALGHREEK